MTGDENEPYATVGAALNEPVRRPRRWWLVALIVVPALLLGTTFALVLRDDYVNGALLFCSSEEAAAALEDEALALVPEAATNVVSSVSDCDDRRATSIQFTDNGSSPESVFQAAESDGWVRATPTCVEKQIGDRDVHLVAEILPPQNPDAGQLYLYASPGSC